MIELIFFDLASSRHSIAKSYGIVCIARMPFRCIYVVFFAVVMVVKVSAFCLEYVALDVRIVSK